MNDGIKCVLKVDAFGKTVGGNQDFALCIAKLGDFLAPLFRGQLPP